MNLPITAGDTVGRCDISLTYIFDREGRVPVIPATLEEGGLDIIMRANLERPVSFSGNGLSWEAGSRWDQKERVPWAEGQISSPNCGKVGLFP